MRTCTRLKIGTWGLLFLLAVGSTVAGALHVDNRVFRDAQGGMIILRGVNVAGDSKVPPFRGITDLSQLDPLPALGVNVIRLLFTWEAYEPLPGFYDQQYLDYLTAVVQGASDRGLYVIIDFHQDGFSRNLSGGCGEGFPLWAIAPGSTPDPPDNGASCENWVDQMVGDPDMHTSFSAFYADFFGVRTRFLAVWQLIAERFSNFPAVIGYDLINEPWGAEATEILPLYESTAAVIRAEDPTSILFLEPHILVGNGFQTAMPQPSIGNFAYAPHFYDPSVFFDKNWSGSSDLTDFAFFNMNLKAEQWGVPLFLGEFGGPVDAIGVAAYVDLIYQRLNNYLASGAQWNYTPGWTPTELDGWNAENLSIVDGAGQLRSNFEIRPYPQRISGTPIELNVSDDGLSIELIWFHVRQTGRTELFVPKAALFGAQPVQIETGGAGLLCWFNGPQTHVQCNSLVNGFKRVLVRPAP